ncbi:MAG: hypothetical protein AB1791_21910, partial [Chloroflexota bacterium]
EWFLPARSPFNLTTVVRSHGWVQLAPFASNDDYSHFSYVTRLPSGRVVELLTQAAPGGVSMQVDGTLEAADQEAVKSQVAWMVGLDQDFSTFYNLARQEPKLSHVPEKAQGRVLRSPTLFEDVVKTILTTNTTWSGTKRMNQALITYFGDPLPTDPGRRAFPTPEQVATADVETLRTTVRLGYRAPYVLELAQAVAGGRLDLEALKTAGLPTLELRKRLLAIKGVGGYAAANLLVILGHYDFLPVDSWALKLVAHEWHDGRPIGPAEVEAAFAHWGEWKGLAYWFWNWSYTG